MGAGEAVAVTASRPQESESLRDGPRGAGESDRHRGRAMPRERGTRAPRTGGRIGERGESLIASASGLNQEVIYAALRLAAAATSKAKSGGDGMATLYSPPSPPTPLSPKKYFWLRSASASDDAGTRASDSEDGDSSCGCEDSKMTADARMIPAVYISRRVEDGESSRNCKGPGGSSPKACPGSGPISGDAKDGKEGKGNSSSRYALLYCHGHDVDLGSIYDFLVHLSRSMELDVMGFDYAGYGLSVARGTERAETDVSDGSNLDEPAGGGESSGASPPSVEQCCNDVYTCYRYLNGAKKIPPQNIILYGKGLGSGPACWLAHKLVGRAARRATKEDAETSDGILRRFDATPDDEGEGDGSVKKSNPAQAPTPRTGLRSGLTPPLGGLILHSAFLSILRLRVSSGFAALAPSADAFDNLRRLREMHGPDEAAVSLAEAGASHPGRDLPIYVIHGREDKVVPFEHGRTLQGLLMRKRTSGFFPFWADGGTHYNIEQKYATAFIKRLQQFLRYCHKVNRSNRKQRRKTKSTITPRVALRTLALEDGVPGGGRHDPKELATQHESRQDRNSERRRQATCDRQRLPQCTSSKRRARKKKKKGTLVMRGSCDGDVGDEGSAAG